MQLLLPSAKHGVMIEIPQRQEWRYKKEAEMALIALGLIVVVWGSLDLLSRLPEAAPGDTTLRNAFAPAVMLGQ